MSLWEFLNSKLGLLSIGFLFTGVIGALLSAWFQNASWKRETRLELFKKRYEEGVAFLEEIGKLVGRRCFATQQMLWELERDDKPQFEETARTLNQVTEEWNNCLRLNRAKIRLLVGESHANRFLGNLDDEGEMKRSSLHRAFVDAHQAVFELSEGRGALDGAKCSVRDLNHMCSDFLESLTNDFLRRASSLELLTVPESSRVRPKGPS